MSQGLVLVTAVCIGFAAAAVGCVQGNTQTYDAASCKTRCNTKLSAGCFDTTQFSTCYSSCTSGTTTELEVLVNCMDNSSCDVDCTTTAGVTVVQPTTTCSEVCQAYAADCADGGEPIGCDQACGSPLAPLITACFNDREAGSCDFPEDGPCDELDSITSCGGYCFDLDQGGCIAQDTFECEARCAGSPLADRDMFTECVDMQFGTDITCSAPGEAEQCMSLLPIGGASVGRPNPAGDQ